MGAEKCFEQKDQKLFTEGNKGNEVWISFVLAWSG